MKWTVTLHFDAPDAPGGRDSEQYTGVVTSLAQAMIRAWATNKTDTNPVIIMEAE